MKVEENDRDVMVYRGDIWTADLGEDNIIGSEQKGYRPVLVLQNNLGNKHSPTVIVACITKQIKTSLPVHMSCDLYEPSTIMFEQITTISKTRLRKKLGHMDGKLIEEANRRLCISFGLVDAI